MRFLLILFIISCASQKSVKYPELKNSDFKAQTKFKNQEFSFSSKEKISKLLYDESINRIFTKVDLKADNLISEMLLNCYEKDFSKSLELSRKHYMDYSKNISYWNVIGTCYLLQGKYLKADLYFNEGLEIYANYSPILNNKAIIKERLGDDQAALALLEKSVKYSRSSRTSRFNLGLIYLKYLILPKAKPIFVELYKEFPGDMDVINALALISALEGNYKQALKVYMQMDIKLFRHANYGLGMAISLYNDGKEKAAREILNDIDEGSVNQMALKKSIENKWRRK